MPFLSIGLCTSLTAETFKKLKELGLTNISDFCASSAENISRRSDIPLPDVQAIRHVLLAKYGPMFLDGNISLQQMTSFMAILPTGCNALNVLLDGGLYTSEVTEVYGSSGVGKTQLCLSCAMAVTSEVQQTCLYIDTGGSFNVTRFADMIASRSSSRQQCEDASRRLEIANVFTLAELFAKLSTLQERLKTKSTDFDQNLRLVVIDCVSVLASPLLAANFTFACGLLNQLARCLKSLAAEYSLAILVSNIAVDEGGAIPRPGLGKTWSHVPNVRLLLTHHNERRCSLTKSCRQALGSMTFKITSKGLEDG